MMLKYNNPELTIEASKRLDSELVALRVVEDQPTQLPSSRFFLQNIA